MSVLGSMKGVGTVVSGDSRFPNVHYELEVRATGPATKRGDGWVKFKSLRDQMAAFNLAKAVLELEKGGAIDILLDGTTLGSNTFEATFVVSGPIPGF
jgi:hypothetical protein